MFFTKALMGLVVTDLWPYTLGKINCSGEYGISELQRKSFSKPA
jgi:hypothetical protein